MGVIRARAPGTRKQDLLRQPHPERGTLPLWEGSLASAHSLVRTKPASASQLPALPCTLRTRNSMAKASSGAHPEPHHGEHGRVRGQVEWGCPSWNSGILPSPVSSPKAAMAPPPAPDAVGDGGRMKSVHCGATPSGSAARAPCPSSGALPVISPLPASEACVASLQTRL